MKTLALALAAMTVGGAAMTAHATAPVRVMVQEPVGYHDLNLETELGAETLLTRIQSAARKVCILANPDLMRPTIRDERQSCTEAATARAVASINAPALTRRAISLGVIDAWKDRASPLSLVDQAASFNVGRSPARAASRTSRSKLN
ncbi:MAG TPA: UrcA family protein [Steroidobacteraceae bacterium]|jgi:UrcA family protein|nr:UrcA family protein [Steroidobacteraceae bacterium]